MSNGSRIYTSRMTLMPPPEVPGDGQVDFYSVGGDPSGVINGTLGDRAFEIGGTTKWVCLGGLVWQVDGQPPIGPASGDLSGTYPGPLVVGLNGIPIDTAAPANGDALLYNGLTNEWQHASILFGGGPPVGPAGGDLGGLYPNPGVVGLQTRPVSPAAPAVSDVLAWDGVQWIPTPPAAIPLPVVYGQFYDSTDQSLAPNTPLVLQYNTVGSANGVSVVNDPITLRPTRLTVAVAGVYEVAVSLQMLQSGGGGAQTITFWLRVDGVNLPDSASSIEMGNNNRRTLPFVPIILPLAAGQYVEWVVMSTGNTDSVEHFPPVIGPPAVPAIPSVIASVKRLGA